MNTAPQTPQASNPPDGRVGRNTQPLLPLWRITGTLTTHTPLALGTGEDEPIASHLNATPDQSESFIPAVARDYNGHPYIPGSSLKGALRALAARVNLPDEIWQQWLGSDKAGEGGDTTTPGALEVRNAYVQQGTLPATSSLPGNNENRHSAVIPHVVIDRHTGTADEGLLFQEQVVPPGMAFQVELLLRGVDEANVRQLLGLLEATAPQENAFTLGKNTGKSNGNLNWALSEVKRLDSFAVLRNPDIKDLWASVKPLQNLKATPLTVQAKALTWDVNLKFHTPFLVYQSDMQRPHRTQGDPNGIPRRNHENRGVLPASSLHGALRSQAERILRTLGQKVARPHGVNPVYDLEGAAADLDEVGLLFGATGWKGLLQCSDFLAPANAPTLKHDMLAIDRITGGGKDGAKFCVQALDCPTLTGQLRLDLPRWQKLAAQDSAKAHRVLALLLHTLRDLDEGDIPLGYGASKGYGLSTGQAAQKLHQSLKAPAQSDGQLPDPAMTLVAWAQQYGDQAPEGTKPSSPTQVPQPFGIKPAGGDFLNPYAFIPFGRASQNDTRLPWDPYASVNTKPDSLRDASPHSHAQYHPARLSGRIVCQVAPQTPWFVGSGAAQGQGNDVAKLQQPFKLDGKLAIPATSLRGLISSLHESVTRSRLRVMHETTYSIRTPMETPLSAIGRLCRIGGKFYIQMLALPTLEIKNNQATIPMAYRRLLPAMRSGVAPLKTLFGDLLAGQTTPTALIPADVVPPKVYYLAKNAPTTFWVMERPNLPLVINIAKGDENHLHIKQAGQRQFLIGLRARPSQFPVEKDQCSPQSAAAGWQPGYVRLMSKNGRDLVKSRKHEVFLPAAKPPINQINDRTRTEPNFDISKIDLTAEYQLLPVPDEVIQRFNRLADEMTASQDNKAQLQDQEIRPYQPLGRARGAGSDKVHHGLKHPERALRPKNGDFVFFKPAADGNSIAEISYSSLWRQEIDASTTDWVPEPLRPLHPNADPKTESLSPSEWLFGAVQVKTTDRPEVADSDDGKQATIAFASKVRIGCAVWTQDAPKTAAQAVTLKILSSPKPPSPSMYVQATKVRGGNYVSKLDVFNDPKGHQFKGRKTYLSALRQSGSGQVQPLTPNGMVGGTMPPWQSAKPTESGNQKVRIQPNTGGVFHFHVDFKNLSQSELESLCASLSPHPDFEHKIGMGKPLGLGSIKIEFVGLYLVDRAKRYMQTDFIAAARYHALWCNTATVHQLPGYMAAERNAVTNIMAAPSPRALADAHMHYLQKAAPEVHRALVLTGSPQAVTVPVHYPQLEGKELESETFAWFVNNDAPASAYDGHQQALRTFTSASDSLPALTRIQRSKNGR